MIEKKMIKSPEYWLTKIQNELFRNLDWFKNENFLNQNELADKFKVSKGHISQILNGESNFTLKKLISLSLKIGKIPVIKFVPVDEYLEVEKDIDKLFDKINNSELKIIKNTKKIRNVESEKNIPVRSDKKIKKSESFYKSKSEKLIIRDKKKKK